MKLYFTIILSAMAEVIAVNLAFSVAHWQYVLIAVAACTAYQFITDGIGAFIVHLIPPGRFSPNGKRISPSARTLRIYERLGVRKWKDKVWELGGLGGFKKNKLASPDSPEYFDRFLIESNKGVLTHRIGYFTGFTCMLFLPFPGIFTIGLPVAAVNLVLNVLPVIILRYNAPRLAAVRDRLKKREGIKQ